MSKRAAPKADQIMRILCDVVREACPVEDASASSVLKGIERQKLIDLRQQLARANRWRMWAARGERADDQCRARTRSRTAPGFSPDMPTWVASV